MYVCVCVCVQDIYTVDESIPQTVRSYLQCIAKVTGVILYSRYTHILTALSYYCLLICY